MREKEGGNGSVHSSLRKMKRKERNPRATEEPFERFIMQIVETGRRVGGSNEKGAALAVHAQGEAFIGGQVVRVRVTLAQL